MNYVGAIIEESLKDPPVIKIVKILKTRVEKVTYKHKTPWLKVWTLHFVEVRESQIDKTADLLSQSIEGEHSSWYIDLKNDKYHYIIFPDKIFKVDLKTPDLYEAARQYGLSLGIPRYQMTFESLKR